MSVLQIEDREKKYKVKEGHRVRRNLSSERSIFHRIPGALDRAARGLQNLGIGVMGEHGNLGGALHQNRQLIRILSERMFSGFIQTVDFFFPFVVNCKDGSDRRNQRPRRRGNHECDERSMVETYSRCYRQRYSSAVLLCGREKYFFFDADMTQEATAEFTIRFLIDRPGVGERTGKQIIEPFVVAS